MRGRITLDNFITDVLWPVLVGLLLAAMLCGCACEKNLEHWLEYKNEQLKHETL